MEEEGFARAVELNLCSRCICVFINPKYEEILHGSVAEMRDYISSQHPTPSLPPIPPSVTSSSPSQLCSCCLGFFQGSSIGDVLSAIERQLDEKRDEYRSLSFSIKINIPPILETLRIGIRTLIFQSVNKLAPSPSFEEQYERFLIHRLQDSMTFVSPDKADVMVRSPFLLSCCRPHSLFTDHYRLVFYRRDRSGGGH
jgi:hypothetical protein